jgi:hypothetical protein
MNLSEREQQKNRASGEADRKRKNYCAKQAQRVCGKATLSPRQSMRA